MGRRADFPWVGDKFRKHRVTTWPLHIHYTQPLRITMRPAHARCTSITTCTRCTLQSTRCTSITTCSRCMHSLHFVCTRCTSITFHDSRARTRSHALAAAHCFEADMQLHFQLSGASRASTTCFPCGATAGSMVRPHPTPLRSCSVSALSVHAFVSHLVAVNLSRMHALQALF